MRKTRMEIRADLITCADTCKAAQFEIEDRYNDYLIWLILIEKRRLNL